MSKKILYIHNGSDFYGASRSLLRLVTRIDRSKYEPLVILPSNGPLADALRAKGIPLYIMKSLSVISRHVFYSWRIVPFLLMIPFSVILLTRFIKKNKIDLVHTNLGTVVSTGLAARLAGVPHVWHVRDSFHEFSILWNLYSRHILWSSDKVVCVSTVIAKQFRDDKGKVIVVHNGLPADEFESVSARRVQTFKNQYGLDGKRTVGVIGRIKFQRKGQDVFVKAIALLKGKLNNVKYLIVGSPFPGNENHLVNLLNLIDALGIKEDVILTGDVQDVPAVYKSLDVLVLPSSQPEPFPGVVLEAMAMGTPVVATAIGGTVEQIEDGISGMLVEPNNPEMLAEKIELLLNDASLHQRMRQASLKRVEERFRFETMCRKLEEIYSEVLSS